MKYFSMFSGIGGFELGIQRAFDNEYAHVGTKSEPQERTQGRKRSTDKLGVQLQPRDRTAPLCVGYSEIDKYAIKVYERIFKGHKNYGDATTINPAELPDFELLVGGFPCQAFSVAGKRAGFNDTRGTLFFDIARILSEKRPRHLVLENVKGLLSHDTAKLSRQYLGFSPIWGIELNGKYLTAKTSAFPKTESGCSLSDILEENVEEKYFLSERMKAHIFSQKQGQNQKPNLHLQSLQTREVVKKTTSYEQTSRVHERGGLSPTVPTASGGHHIPMILESAD